jgi:hypothetical protein
MKNIYTDVDGPAELLGPDLVYRIAHHFSLF